MKKSMQETAMSNTDKSVLRIKEECDKIKIGNTVFKLNKDGTLFL